MDSSRPPLGPGQPFPPLGTASGRILGTAMEGDRERERGRGRKGEGGSLLDYLYPSHEAHMTIT